MLNLEVAYVAQTPRGAELLDLLAEEEVDKGNMSP